MIRIATRALSVSVTALVFAVTGSLAVSAQTPDDMKVTEAQCNTLWTQALAGSSGDLSREKADPYVNDFKKVDKNSDGVLSEAEWTTACEQGWVRSSSDGAGDGVSGSSEKTSDRTPGDPSPSRTPGATGSGAAGTDAAQTTEGTSDRTPANH